MTNKATTFATLKSGPSQLRREKTDIEEWGEGPFYLTEISALTHKKIIPTMNVLMKKDEDGNIPQENGGEMMATWISYLVVDSEGKSPEVEWLMTQPIRLLQDVSNRALKFNGLSSDAKEEAEKNSPTEETTSSE